MEEMWEGPTPKVDVIYPIEIDSDKELVNACALVRDRVGLLPEVVLEPVWADFQWVIKYVPRSAIALTRGQVLSLLDSAKLSCTVCCSCSLLVRLRSCVR
jgi:hypothetical protein